MTKKGDLLNQLAIITDLLEKVNLETIDTTLSFSLSEENFEQVKNYIIEKSKTEPKMSKKDSVMHIYIGDVQIMLYVDPK